MAARETTANFRILGRISHAETIAQGAGIRELPRLRRLYGAGNWRKRKGTARIRLDNGDIRVAELHWYEARRGAQGNQAQTLLGLNMTHSTSTLRAEYVVCINNRGYPASLELHKIYRTLPDDDAAASGEIRVVDESGEDYLYRADAFVAISLPDGVRASFRGAASP